MMSKPLDGLLGLCRRAGKLGLGHDAVQADISAKKACLCLLARDASPRLKREMERTAAMAGSETAVLQTEFDKTELSQSIGAKPIAVLTVNDAGFAKAIVEQIGKDGYYDEKI